MAQRLDHSLSKYCNLFRCRCASRMPAIGWPKSLSMVRITSLKLTDTPHKLYFPPYYNRKILASKGLSNSQLFDVAAASTPAPKITSQGPIGAVSGNFGRSRNDSSAILLFSNDITTPA